MNLSSVYAMITRPEPQAQELAEAILRAKGRVWVMPMLAIQELEVSSDMKQRLFALNRYNRIIVTSRPAARFGVTLMREYWSQLPANLLNREVWFAIGCSTCTELANYQIIARSPLSGADSEALLQLKELANIEGEHILILKGEGGRTLLQKSLKERGANVDSLSVYRRYRPEYSSAAIVKHLETQSINVILCGSGETVVNLGYYLPESYRRSLRVIVPSQRVVQLAKLAGFHLVHSANGPSRRDMLLALESLQAQRCLVS